MRTFITEAQADTGCGKMVYIMYTRAYMYMYMHVMWLFMGKQNQPLKKIIKLILMNNS